MQRLITLQGDSVPKLLGAFHLRFPDRELVRDRVVYCTLMEYVPGPMLTEVAIASMMDNEAQELWNQIYKSIKALHANGVIKRLPYMRKLIWKKEEEKIVCTDLSWSRILDGNDPASASHFRGEISSLYHQFNAAWNGEVFE